MNETEAMEIADTVYEEITERTEDLKAALRIHAMNRFCTSNDILVHAAEALVKALGEERESEPEEGPDIVFSIRDRIARDFTDSKIDAVQEYRAATLASLTEAKSAVEKIYLENHGHRFDKTRENRILQEAGAELSPSGHVAEELEMSYQDASELWREYHGVMG